MISFSDLRIKIAPLAFISLLLGLTLIYNSGSEVNKASNSKVDVDRLRVTNQNRILEVKVDYLERLLHNFRSENDTKGFNPDFGNFDGVGTSLDDVQKVLEDKLTFWLASGSGSLFAGALQASISGWFLLNLRNNKDTERNAGIWLKGSMGAVGMLMTSFGGFYFSDLHSDRTITTLGADFYTLNFLLMVASRFLKSHQKQKEEVETSEDATELQNIDKEYKGSNEVNSVV